MSGEPLLRVENLSKTFVAHKGIFRRRGADVRAVDGVSFSLSQGETLGLVGETGSGKSTIGRLVLRLLEPSSGGIWFDGEDISHISRSRARRLRRNLQMVFQDPYGSLDPRMKVASIIAEPMVVEVQIVEHSVHSCLPTTRSNSINERYLRSYFRAVGSKGLVGTS